MKWYEIWPRPKGWVKKILRNLRPNFVKDPFEGWLKFNIVCIDAREWNDAKGYIMLKKPFFYQGSKFGKYLTKF